MNHDVETKSWKARLKMAVAGLALAGALAGGAAVAADQAAPAEDTTESAWGGYQSMSGWGVSWR